jgi:transposase-like protein
MSTRKRYSDEFKVEAVKLTETSAATIATIAKELGVSVATLNEWRAKAKRGKLRGPGGKVVSFNDARSARRIRPISAADAAFLSERTRSWLPFSSGGYLLCPVA